MISFKARLIIFMMRNRQLFEGKLKRQSISFNKEEVYAFRKKCEDGATKFGKLPANIGVENERIEGINAEWLIPENSSYNKIIFYVHGGGYVSGSCNDHRAIIAKLAANLGVTCLLYDYRLAPEHPFPSAIYDSLKMYRAVIKKGYNPKDILIMGESAGGGLALALLLAIKAEKLPQSVACVAISPWTDLTCSGETYRSKNKVSVAPANSWNVFSHYYVAENNPKNPLISPLFGSLEGLPPVYINSAANDELYDDGQQFYEKAKAAGVDITFRAGEGMPHCYPLLAPMFKEANEAMQEIKDFIMKYLF